MRLDGEQVDHSSQSRRTFKFYRLIQREMPTSDDGSVEKPPIRVLASGIFGVAYTLAGIIVVGIILDHLLGLPIWLGGLWRWLGAVPIITGLALEAAGTYAFWKYGKGTPNPVAHPSQLVTRGPYSWSRHPLYLARHLILLGFASLLGSPSILILTILLFLLVQIVLIPREEGRLAARFGEPYAEYRSHVSKWASLPRTFRRLR